MGIELPVELTDVAAKAGVRWPEADEEAMRHAAKAWRDAGTELTAVTSEADSTVGRALTGVRGATGDAARQHWDTFVRPGGGHLSGTVAGCTAAAERLEHAADQVGAAKVEIVRNLVGLAKNTDVAELAAAAGDPTALAELGDLQRSTAASVAQVHENLTHAVRQDTGVSVADTSAAVGKAVLHPQLPLGGSAGGDGLLGGATQAVTGVTGLTGGHGGQGGGHGILGDVGGTADRVLGGAGGPGGSGGGHGGHGLLGDVAGTADRVVGGPGGAGGPGGSGGHGLLGDVGNTADRVLGDAGGPGGAGGHGLLGDVAGTADRALGGHGVSGVVHGVAGTAGDTLGGPGGQHGPGGHGGQGLVGDVAGTADRALGDVTGGDRHGPVGPLVDQVGDAGQHLAGGHGPGAHGPLDGIDPRGGAPADQLPGPAPHPDLPGGHPDNPGWSVGDGHTGPVRIDPQTGDTGPIAVGDDGRPLPPDPSGTVRQSSAAVLDGPRPLAPEAAAPAQSAPPPANPGGSYGGGSYGGSFGGAAGGGAGGGGAAGAGALPGPRADAFRPDARANQSSVDAFRPDLRRQQDAARADVPARQEPRQEPARQEPLRQEPARQDLLRADGRTDAAIQRATGARQSVIALFLVHMFPIGHLPVPVNRPARQLPAPPTELDYAAGLRFPPADHPDSASVHDTGALANATSAEPVRIIAGPPMPRQDARLATVLDGYDPLGGAHERDWDRRFQVRAARPQAGAAPEYAWPPGELFPEGGTDHGEAVTLPPGTELDRFGPPDGRVLAEAGAVFTGRSLPPGHITDGYRRYRVTEPLPVWRAVSAPWFGQPGGAVRYRAVYPATDLVALGYLADITDETGEHG